jgi:hypothetical protein
VTTPRYTCDICGQEHSQDDVGCENVRKVLKEVILEWCRASSLHPPYNSAHEGYAVLLEEVDELWDEVKKGGTEPRDPEALRAEAIQVAAVAIRFLTDVCGKESNDG